VRFKWATTDKRRMRRSPGGQNVGGRQRITQYEGVADLSVNSYNCITDDVKLGANVRLSKFINRILRLRRLGQSQDYLCSGF